MNIDRIIEATIEDAIGPDTCDHVGEPIKKFDGGRLPLLCPKCYRIIGNWTPDE